MNPGPRYAEHVPGKGRYYTRPSTGEQLISVTTVLDTMNKPALVPWATKVTAAAAWQNLPRMNAASLDQAKVDELTREIRDEIDVVRERASDLGTRVHALAEAHILGRPEPDDPEAAPYVKQYLRFLSEFGVDIERDVEATECTVIHPEHGYAGTLDILVRLFGQLWQVDIKSSATQASTRVYETHPLQQVAYQRAPLILLDDGREIDKPTPDRCAILNLRTGTYSLIPLDTGDEEFAAFLGLLTAARWQHGTWHDSDPRPITPAGDIVPRRIRRKKEAA